MGYYISFGPNPMSGRYFRLLRFVWSYGKVEIFPRSIDARRAGQGAGERNCTTIMKKLRDTELRIYDQPNDHILDAESAPLTPNLLYWCIFIIYRELGQSFLRSVCRLDDWGIVVRLSSKTRQSAFLQPDKTRTRDPPSPVFHGSWCSFPDGIAAEAWSWPICSFKYWD